MLLYAIDPALTASQEAPRRGSILKRQQSSTHTRSVSSGEFILTHSELCALLSSGCIYCSLQLQT